MPVKMRYIQATITRSELCSIPVEIPAWELALIQAIHGESNVVITGESEYDNAWPGDAAAEFDRLAQRYKAPEGAPPFVEQVYGVSVGGQQALGRSISQAYQEAKANPIDYAAKAKAAIVKAQPKISIDYGDDAPMTLGDALTDAQLDALDTPAALMSPTTGVNLAD